MTDTKPALPNLQPITEEQLQRISGGDCTVRDVIEIFDSLKENYDILVDFTSYVIERVMTSTTGT
jgi:hypothetical protein